MIFHWMRAWLLCALPSAICLWWLLTFVAANARNVLFSASYSDQYPAWRVNSWPPNSARADDTKGMKGPIIDWITLKGQSLIPHIPHSTKSGCGFNHDLTGALLCPAGLDWNNVEWVIILSVFRYLPCGSGFAKSLEMARYKWPIFVYTNYTYDLEDPWNRLLRSGLLVSVSSNGMIHWMIIDFTNAGLQTHFHVPQFHRSGTQGNVLWKCPHPWHALSDEGISCLCCHTGKYGWMLFFNGLTFCRYALHWHRPKYFRVLILSQISNTSTLVFLSCLMTQMKKVKSINWWLGGIGELACKMIDVLLTGEQSSISIVFGCWTAPIQE